MTTLTEFKEIEAKQTVEHKRDEHGCESCNATKAVQRIAPKALPALIAVAEGMAEALRDSYDVEQYPADGSTSQDKALAAFEAWKDNIEGEK